MLADLGLALAVLLSAAAVALGVAAAAPRLHAPAAGDPDGALRRRLVRPLAARLRRLLGPGLERRLRDALRKAGHPHGLAPEELLSLGTLSAASLTVAAVPPVLFADAGAAFVAPAPAAGFALPFLWLSGQVRARQGRITRALPFHLDLLTLAVEAGLDFVAALAKVVERGRPGPLRDELALVLKELRMGRTREEALRGMAVRSGHPGLTAFATALIQADRMGTNLGGVLRIQSATLRHDRTQRAEKLAGEAPVKLLLPLVLFLFPTVFLVLMGPILFALTHGGAGVLP